MMVGYLLLLGVRDVGRSSYSRGMSRLSTGLSAGLSAGAIPKIGILLGFYVHIWASYLGEDIANHMLYHQ